MSQQELNVDEVIFVKNLIGSEDVLFGMGTEQQIRDGEIVVITRVNADSIPYRKANGEMITIAGALDELYERTKNVN